MIQMKKIQYVLASLLAASVFTTAAEAANFNNEVKTDQLITKLISLRKTVAAPVTLKNERKLIPFKITNLKDEWFSNEKDKDIENVFKSESVGDINFSFVFDTIELLSTVFLY